GTLDERRRFHRYSERWRVIRDERLLRNALHWLWEPDRGPAGLDWLFGIHHHGGQPPGGCGRPECSTAMAVRHGKLLWVRRLDGGQHHRPRRPGVLHPDSE